MRYLPLTADDRRAMLAKVGVASVDELFRDVPAPAREPRFALPAHAGEMEVERSLARQVAQITGMEVANASMYDGSTATAEAVLMAHRVTGRNRAVLSGNLHPHYAETVRTMAGLAGEIVTTQAVPGATEDFAS